MTKVATHALVLWGFMFAVTSALYPLSIGDPVLFGSIRVVVLAFATTASAMLYLRGVQAHFARRAAIVAATWTTTCVVFDLVVLAMEPPRFGIVEYFRQIGVTYLVIPAIVFGLTFQQSRRHSSPRGGSGLRPALHKK